MSEFFHSRELMESLSPAARALLAELDVVCDAQLTDLDLETTPLAPEDLRRLEEALRRLPPDTLSPGPSEATLASWCGVPLDEDVPQDVLLDEDAPPLEETSPLGEASPRNERALSASNEALHSSRGDATIALGATNAPAPPGELDPRPTEESHVHDE